MILINHLKTLKQLVNIKGKLNYKIFVQKCLCPKKDQIPLTVFLS